MLAHRGLVTILKSTEPHVMPSSPRGLDTGLSPLCRTRNLRPLFGLSASIDCPTLTADDANA